MCGIAGQVSLAGQVIPRLRLNLQVMNDLQKHRGPDGEGVWEHPAGIVGFGHRRLSIIDLATGGQPMTDRQGNWITYNGEIYNYIELRKELGEKHFATTCDTEVILMAYRKWGADCVSHLRGMFAFALWDEEQQTLFCARDRFGIKPFYYAVMAGRLVFASEAKAVLPFLDTITTDLEGFKDYLAFQFCLAGKTLFLGVHELLPGHMLTVKNGHVTVRRYWEVQYDVDFQMTQAGADARLRDLLSDSVRVHLRSDVPIGTYLSGGFDSSIVASLATRAGEKNLIGFNGKFSFSPDYDESRYARALAEWCGFGFADVDISVSDFIGNIRKIMYHMDYPAAGPGVFPQFMVSRLASHQRKVVLGGQGGDEVFGGYARYLIAYFEQCIKAAVDGTMRNGNFVVTYESIIPNLVALRNYKGLLQEFWRDGLFDDMDKRYFRLINRAPLLGDEVNWVALGDYSPYETFRSIFHGTNVKKESYFDQMTHFDFKTLLPALLQVEDRVSMAHGIESRVPFLDHPLVEFAATIPANIKFKDGTMKHALKSAMRSAIPDIIAERKDKMGFPVPLTEWIQGEARGFVQDTLSSSAALGRELIDNRKVLAGLAREPKFSRKVWGLLCLELWQQEFHDRRVEFRTMLKREERT